MATFEIVDGDLIEEYLWQIKDDGDDGKAERRLSEDLSDQVTRDSELDYYAQSAGLDGREFGFTLGFPLYVYIWSCLLVAVLSAVNAVCNCRKRSLDAKDEDEDEAEAEDGEGEKANNKCANKCTSKR